MPGQLQIISALANLTTSFSHKPPLSFAETQGVIDTGGEVGLERDHQYYKSIATFASEKPNFFERLLQKIGLLRPTNEIDYSAISATMKAENEEKAAKLERKKDDDMLQSTQFLRQSTNLNEQSDRHEDVKHDALLDSTKSLRQGMQQEKPSRASRKLLQSVANTQFVVANNTVVNPQMVHEPKSASLYKGGIVEAWNNQQENNCIAVKTYNQDGTVAATAQLNLSGPFTVTGLTDGNFIVIASSSNGTIGQPQLSKGQILDSTCTPVGDVFDIAIAQPTIGPSTDSITIKPLADGGFAATTVTVNTTLLPNEYATYQQAQIYYANGTLNTMLPNSPYGIESGDIEELTNRNIALVSSSYSGTYLNIYNPNGTLQCSASPLQGNTASIAAVDNSGVGLTISLEGTVDYYETQAQFYTYNSDCSVRSGPVGIGYSYDIASDFFTGTSTSSLPGGAVLSMLYDDNAQISGDIFNCSASNIEGIGFFSININPTSIGVFDSSPTIAAFQNGDFVVSWVNYANTPTSLPVSILGQRFTEKGKPIPMAPSTPLLSTGMAASSLSSTGPALTSASSSGSSASTAQTATSTAAPHGQTVAPSSTANSQAQASAGKASSSSSASHSSTASARSSSASPQEQTTAASTLQATGTTIRNPGSSTSLPAPFSSTVQSRLSSAIPSTQATAQSSTVAPSSTANSQATASKISSSSSASASSGGTAPQEQTTASSSSGVSVLAEVSSNNKLKTILIVVISSIATLATCCACGIYKYRQKNAHKPAANYGQIELPTIADSGDIAPVSLAKTSILQPTSSPAATMAVVIANQTEATKPDNSAHRKSISSSSASPSVSKHSSRVASNSDDEPPLVQILNKGRGLPSLPRRTYADIKPSGELPGQVNTGNTR